MPEKACRELLGFCFSTLREKGRCGDEEICFVQRGRPAGAGEDKPLEAPPAVAGAGCHLFGVPSLRGLYELYRSAHGHVQRRLLGLAQLLRMGLESLVPGLQSLGDLAGAIYFLLNLPLLAIAWSRFGHYFLGKTIACVLFYSVLLAVIPIPEVGVFDEVLTACVIGGLLCGAGAGLTLTAGCSGGGEEILGLLCAMKNPWFSVGRISMLLNIGVFGTGLFLFDRQSVVYSILMAGVMYLCLDRVHLQNVMVAMFIITKREDMEKLVFQRAGRGVTRWVGEGAYSSQETDILLTVVSKKEALSLRRALQERDPNVFAIICEDISVVGNFQKRV